MRTARKVWAIVRKDIETELLTREIVSAMLVFAVLSVVVFGMALDLERAAARLAAPGVYWTTVCLAGTLGLSRSLAREQADGCLEGLLLGPFDRSVIYLGKLVGNVIFIIVVEIVLAPVLLVLFDVSLFSLSFLFLAVLGTIGYSAVGTLIAVVASNTRAREVMLPILLLPLVVPLLIPLVQATQALLDGALFAEIRDWVRIVAVYDVVILAVALVVFDHAVES